eukprot:s462_g11.t1
MLHCWTLLLCEDFTPVCTTELAMCNSLVEEFQRRSVSVSVGAVELGFPLIADETREIASMLGMLDPLEICNVERIAMPARALFLIGPDKRNRLTILYPATTGRNFSEVLRVIDSLHITHCGPEVGTPADWHFGEDVMPATNVAEDAFVDKAKEKPVPIYEAHPPTNHGQRAENPASCRSPARGQRLQDQVGREVPRLRLEICWPRNFDPVATTELMGCLKFLPDLRQRRVSMIGMSCDGVESLGQWVKDAVVVEVNRSAWTSVDHAATPKDRNLNIAATLGFLPSDTAGHDTCPARGLFVIGKDKTLRLSMQYPMTTGLNFAEILRVLDSLILSKDLPKGFHSVSKTDASKFDNLTIQSLPSGKEYLRWVDCPKLKWFEEEVSPASPMLDVEEWEPLSPPGKGQQEIRGKEPVEDKDDACLKACGECYVQDMSTNGTRLNGKRLPRPPYKHPMDARVRIFHGDELVLAITPEGEELGFVVNLFDLALTSLGSVVDAEVPSCRYFQEWKVLKVTWRHVRYRSDRQESPAEKTSLDIAMLLQSGTIHYFGYSKQDIPIFLLAPDGVDVLLFVMKKDRVTVAEQETLAYVTQLLFGPECLPNLYMVITHAGRLAKETQRQEAWLQEQVAASPYFAAMIAFLGPEPLSRLLFVENTDLAEAEDEAERGLAEKRRTRALQDVYTMLQRHKAPPFRHSIMRRAGELQAAHLESLRQELKSKIEEELRMQLDKDRGALEAERQRLQEEVEVQRKELREQEEEIRRRFEHEWSRLQMDFTERAKNMARQDLEHMAKDMVDQTEKKVEEQTGAKRGRRCELM